MTTATPLYRYESRIILRRSLGEFAVEDWLTNYELQVLAELRDDWRREEWLFGRILAKQIILDEVIAHPADIEIYSRDRLGRSSRPRVMLHGRLQNWSLSIAHSDKSVLVALSKVPGASVGVDVTGMHVPLQGFLDMWFTPCERRSICDHQVQVRALYASTLWAVKEAFYKATNVGEQFRPLRIEVRTDKSGGYEVRFDGAEARSGCKIRITEIGQEVTVLLTTSRIEDQK